MNKNYGARLFYQQRKCVNRVAASIVWPTPSGDDETFDPEFPESGEYDSDDSEIEYDDEPDIQYDEDEDEDTSDQACDCAKCIRCEMRAVDAGDRGEMTNEEFAAGCIRQ